jgi:hypothetical protein
MQESILSQRQSAPKEKEKPIPQFLLNLFPSQTALKIPEDAALLSEWKKQIEQDKKAMILEANVHQIDKVRCWNQVSGLQGG